MAHQQIGPGNAVSGHSRPQPGERFEAQTVHSGIEMQRERSGPAAPCCESGPAREFLGAANRGRQAMLRIVARLGPALEAVQHVDLRLDRQDAPRR